MIYINRDVTLTVNDSSTEGTGVIDGTGALDSAIWANMGSAVVNGGYIKQGNSPHGLYTGTSLTLNGGTMDLITIGQGTLTLGEDATVNEWQIRGGTFNVDPSTLNGFDSDYYEAVDNGNGTWTVEDKDDDFDPVPNPTSHFRSASVSLGSDLSIIYEVIIIDNLQDGETGFAMEFTMNGWTATVRDYEYLGEDLYAFTFTGIAPHQMGDLIDAELFTLDEYGFVARSLASKDGYSVKQNVINLLSNYSDNETLVQLLSDLLTYGADL